MNATDYRVIDGAGRRTQVSRQTSTVATRVGDDIEERSVIPFLIWHTAVWTQSSAEDVHATSSQSLILRARSVHKRVLRKSQ
jgi:hypothetical protein